MSKQETSIDWLIGQITNSTMSAREAIAKARAMHKQEIVEAFDVGSIVGYNQNAKSGEEFYDETYDNLIIKNKPYIPYIYR